MIPKPAMTSSAMIQMPVMATIERTNGLWFMEDYFDSDVKAFPEIH
jgi:hypothetical protein